MPRSLLFAGALALLAACGSGSSQGDTTAATTSLAPAAAVPRVSIPAAASSELAVTDLTEGSGPAAKDGDVLYVRYVGVRSANGEQFDENFSSGEPFEVTLGAGGVIKGWDEGLVGVKQGGRRQLDIPAALAYGDNPPGAPIKAGDALSFVVDVVGLAATAKPGDKPSVVVAPAANIDAVSTTDLVVGDGVEVHDGQHVAVQLTTFRADTGAELNSTYSAGQPLVFVLGANSIIPGLEQAVGGMRVGGRRRAQLPFALAFGEAGRPDGGLPASTDVVIVIDLTAAF